MKKGKTLPEESSLRQKAEATIEKLNSGNAWPQVVPTVQNLSEAEMQKLLHELQVHQIELEIQNDELQQAVEKASTATALYDFAPNGYFTVRPDGTITQLNHSGAKMLGKRRMYLENSNLKLFISDDTKPVFADFLESCFETRIKQTCEIGLAISGKPLSFLYLEGMVTEDNQQCLVVAVDITERKQVEEMLNANYSLLRIAGETAKFGGWSLDLVEKKVVWSDEVASIHKTKLGYSPTVEEGINFYAPEYRDRITGALSDCAEKGISFDMELELITAKGNRVWVRTAGEALRAKNGKIIKIQGAFQDISKRKRTEQLVAEGEANARAIMESTSDIILLLDKDGTVIDNNEGHAHRFGLTRNDLMGKNIYDFLPEDVGKRRMELVERVIASGQPHYGEDLRDNRLVEFSILPIILENEIADRVAIFAKDITDRKRIEDALQKSRDLFSLFMDYSPIYTFIKEVTPEKSIVLKASENFLDMVGISGKEMEGKTMEKLFPAEFASKITADDWAVISGGKVITLEEELNGRSYTTIKFPILQGDKNLIAGYTIDVTDQKQRERELRESEARFRSTFDQSPVGSVMVGLDSRFMKCNESFCDFVGYSEEELIGKTIADITYPEDLELGMNEMKQLVEGKIEIARLQKRYVRKDGGIVWGELSICVVCDDDNKPIYFLPIIRDITERNQIEAELAESEARFRNLLQAVPSVSVQGYAPDGTTQYWNKASEMLYGYTAEEAIGRNLLDLIIPPEMKADVKLAIQQMAETGQAIPSSELSLMCRNGSYVSVFSSHVIVKIPGRPQELFCIDVDLTDRKRAEEELVELNSRLKELNATKDKFFSIIAHDLKSPFNSILGFSNLLERQIQEKDYAAIEKYAGIIHNSSQQAMDLLMNLLEWSRMQTGRMVFNPESIDIVALIKQSTELLNASAQQKSITIYSEMPVNLSVFADKAMISTILRNLISNAIKFTETGGKIIISTEQMSNELVVSVSDNGVGIMKESIGKLFRIDENNSTLGTQNEKGTGLGLLLCKEFIDKHGGRIWVESEPGKGSRFFFSIPIGNKAN